MKTKDLAIAAIGIVFTAICAQININLSFVPFSLQLFAITLLALTLSKTQAKLSILGYVILGLIGLPVFAGFKGGPQIVISPTFGFILGFIIYVFVIATFKSNKNNLTLSFLLACSYILFYLIGLSVLGLNLKYILNLSLSLDKIFMSYWVVFIPTDLLSIIAALLLSKRLNKQNIRKSG